MRIAPSTLVLAGILATVGSAQIRFRTQELPAAVIGEPYHAPIEAFASGRCAFPDIALSANQRELPAGFEVDSTGLHGIARQVGSYSVTVHAEDGCSREERQYSFIVAARPVLDASPAEVSFHTHKG